MKPYKHLTPLGRLRRIRHLAEAALQEYALADASMKFYLHAGNTLYRVYDTSSELSQCNDDLFETGQYLLRVYQPGWQIPEAIELEMAWLSAMRHEAGLPVPEPVPRLDGRFLTQVAVPGIPQTRYCALCRWVKGRLLPKYGKTEHYQAQGRLMAQIHNFTQQWPLPSGANKRHYDWDGLFMNDPEIGLAPGESWNYVPNAWVEAFEFVARKVRQLIGDWGTGSDVYGLIHADMGVDSNVLFWHGQPRPIDFDGSGFGYWMFDLAVALAHCINTPVYDRNRDALFKGYTEHRSLPAWQFAQLDLFTAAFCVYYDLWVVGGTHSHPEYLTKDMEELMHRGADFILRYAEKHA